MRRLKSRENQTVRLIYRKQSIRTITNIDVKDSIVYGNVRDVTGKIIKVTFSNGVWKRI